MKDFLIITTIIIIILAGDLLINRILESSTDELVNSLKTLKEHVIEAKESENREDIIDEMSDMENNWEKTSELWAIFVVHQEIDNIEQALIKTKAMIRDGNIEDAIPEIDTAIFFVEHVKQRERLSLKNIF